MHRDAMERQERMVSSHRNQFSLLSYLSSPSHPRWSYLLSLINHLSFFRTLPTYLVRRLMMRMTLQYLPMEACVFRAGENSSFLAIILKGEVAVLSSGLGGGKVDRIATLTASDAFGAQSLLDGAPRNTSVVCMVECEMAVLTRRDYLEVLMHRHEEESDMVDTSLASASPNDEQEDGGSGLLSLLSPDFAAQSAIPTGFELTPHLNNYIEILTRQTQAQLAGESRISARSDRRSLKESLTEALRASTGGQQAALTAAAAAFATAPNAAPSSDTIFLLNLLKTCKQVQMHDRRPVLLELTKSLTLHHLPPDTVLFEKGSKATYTYFVLSGSIAVMSHTSYNHRFKARAERRTKRAVVRQIVAKWEEQERKEQAEALRRKNERPNYMLHTQQFSNALKDNADVIAQVQFSATALEKDAERKERARIAREERKKQIDSLMFEHGIEHLDSSEDEEDVIQRERRRMQGGPITGGGAGEEEEKSSDKSTLPPPHQFPLGSCQSILLYPEHIGFQDIDQHLRELQDEQLSANIDASESFAEKEIERATIIAQALSKGQNLGSGAQASAAATAVLKEQQAEKERLQQIREESQKQILQERNARKKRGAGVAIAQARRNAAAGKKSRSPSPDRTGTAASSGTGGTQSLSGTQSIDKNVSVDASALPLYMSPTFADVTYSQTCVTRESCFVARISNSILLAALESPYHGPDVKERLNDPVLRYTVLRPQEIQRITGAQQAGATIDPEDPDAVLAEQKNNTLASVTGKQGKTSATAGSSASSVRLDYSHHIETLFTSMQHLKFFSIQNRELGLKLCSRMQYLSLNKGDILCKQGQLGSLFYIILSGTISIHIKPQFVIPQLAQALSAAEARTRKGRRKKKAGGGGKDSKDSSSKKDSISEPQAQGSVMIQSLMFPSTSPVEQMKQQEREQKEGEAAAAAAAALASKAATRSKSEKQGSVMIQSLMFPSTSPVEQMKQQEREQKEGELALLNGTGGTSLIARKPHVLDGWTPNLSKLIDPPSRIARHLEAPHSAIDELTQLDSLYGPCVKVAVSGDPIGESAIVSSNPRSATCICREPVELFTLSKEDYRAIYAVPQHLKVNTIINLLHKNDVPKDEEDDAPNLGTKDVMLLEHCIRDIEFMKPLHSSIRSILGQRLHHLSLEAGRVVFEQGTRGNYLYIIIAGTCSVYIKPPSAAPAPAATAAALPSLASASSSLSQGLQPIKEVRIQEHPKQSVPSRLGSPSLESSNSAAATAKRLKDEGMQRLQQAAAGLLGAIPSSVASTEQEKDDAAALGRKLMSPAGEDAEPLDSIPDIDMGESALLGEHSLLSASKRASLEREAHESIDAMEAELSSSILSPPPATRALHRRSNRTPSGVERNHVAIENSSARPGAEMLSQSGPKQFKFSAGATVGSAAGGGRAFSAGRIRHTQLEAFPPVTDINLSEQEAAYLHGLGPVSSILSVGSSFGEPALQAGGPGLHTATVVTNGPTDLLLLTRASYAFALESLAQWKADLDEVFQFLKTSHFFHNWSPTLVSKAMNMMERREIKRNEVIIRQGERASHIFFILKGEIHVTQAMQLVDAEIPDITHPSAATLALEKAAVANSPAKKQGKKRRAANGKPGDENQLDLEVIEPDLHSEKKTTKEQKEPVTIQMILKEQRVDQEVLAGVGEKKNSSSSSSSNKPAPAAFTPSYPIKTKNGLVGSLQRPEFGLPLLVPTLTNEDPVPLMPNSGHISNFSSLITASQVVDGLNPNTPIVDGGQIWLHWPQKLGCSFSQVSSGCKRRGAKRIYKNTTNNGTEVALNNAGGSKKSGAILAPAGSSAATTSNEPSGAAVAGGSTAASPVFPFVLELSSLSQNGVCGNLETLLPTVLGVKDLLGRPETEDELVKERERKEREAFAIENGEALPINGPANPNAPPSATQCQLAYPATFTAFTDCTLVAFPTNAFHTLLSATEETLFFHLYLDRLEKNVEKVRRWLEGRYLRNAPFTREILEDFRIYEENVYFSKHRYQPEESVQKERLNALLRPGIKPPALIDYRTEEQLKELKAAGLANHPYTLNLEARAMKNKETASSPGSVLASEIEHDLSFSVTGNMADHKWAAVMSTYVPPVGSEGGRKPKASQARSLLDTICAVGQSNAALPSAPAAVAVEFGRGTFDPMKQLLPVTASHTPEFQAALKYAEHHVNQRHRSSSTTELRSPERVLQESQSLPQLRAGTPVQRSLASSPTPLSPAPSNLALSVPTTPQLSSTGSSLAQTPSNAMLDLPLDEGGHHVRLSPLAKDAHMGKYFSKTAMGQRNPTAAAGMVRQLLTHESHELEAFLSHVKTDEAPSPKRRRKKHTTSIVMDEDDAAAITAAIQAAAAEAESRPETSQAQSGSKYALTSAVLALQSKSSQHAAQTEAQRKYTKQMRAQQYEKKVENSRAQARALAKALCLSDPYAGDSSAEFSAKHIQHLQKAVRGEVPDTRGAPVHSSALKQIQRETPLPREEAKSPLPPSPASRAGPRPTSTFTSPNTIPERRGILLPDEPVDGWSVGGGASIQSSSLDSPSRQNASLAAYSRAHQSLRVQSRLSTSLSTPSLGSPTMSSAPSLTSPHRATGAAPTHTAAALHLLQSTLLTQTASLASGGSMSTEPLRRSQMEAVQYALKEEEEIARQLGVDADVVHAHAGHAAIHQAQKRIQPNRVSLKPTGPLVPEYMSSAPMPALLGGFRVQQPPVSVPPLSHPSRLSNTVALGDGVSVQLPKLPHV